MGTDENPITPSTPQSPSTPEPYSSKLEDQACPTCGNRQRQEYNISNRYRLIEVVGEGGMGVVWKAWDFQLRRNVALKKIRALGNPSSSRTKRFLDEARAAAKLSHPGIVSVYDVGIDEGLYWFTCDFIEGAPLSQHMKNIWDETDSARLIRDIALALQCAHNANIVHRDIKPANIIMDRNNRPRVTDFGLAKRLDLNDTSNRTRFGEILGTPHYLSPEQARGENDQIGPASDQFSLGIIFYELLTGNRPFQGAGFRELCHIIANLDPDRPSHTKPDVDTNLETVVMKMLRKNPSDRYPSLADLAEDLDRFLVGAPIHARPVSKWSHAFRWIRSKKWHAPILLLLFLFLITVIGGAYSFDKLQRALDRDQWVQANHRFEQILHKVQSAHYIPQCDTRVTLTDLQDSLPPLRHSISHPSSLSESVRAHQWHLLGQGWTELGDTFQAEEAFREALRLAPNDLAIQFSWIQHCALHMQLSRLRAESDNIPTSNSPTYQLWSEKARRSLSNQAYPLKRELFTAYRHWLDGNIAEARMTCQESIAQRGKQPGTEDFWLLLGYMTPEEMPPSRIRKYYETATEIAPNSAWAHFLKGKYQTDQKLRQDDFLQATRLAPRMWFAHNALTADLLRNNLLDQAEASSKRTLEIAPQAPDAQVTQAWVHYKFGRLEQAIDCLDHTLAKFPDHISALTTRSALNLQANKTQLSIRDATRVLEIHPKSWETALTLGVNLIRLGEVTRGKNLLKKILDFAPQSKRAQIQKLLDSTSSGKSEEK
ncbi:MAG: protein kinase [Planctomycetota bacterium]|jgi:serine/threonine protein kinase|nr:protein kinase [Planctomycetota bacterium]